MVQDSKAPPRLAVLFWFYRDADVCENRLQTLRRLNPSMPIFGLFGGDPADSQRFRAALGPFLDDFSDCLAERDADWKWLYGDAVIAAWYQKTGHALVWDTIALVQWDMLIFADIRQLLSGLETDELVLSGLRPIEEVSTWWNRVTRDREEYAGFRETIQTRHGPDIKILCCQFVFACLPRTFLATYSTMDLRVGFLEYRLPTYAALLGYRFRSFQPFECWWPKDPKASHIAPRNRVVTAQRFPIPMSTVVWHLLNPSGSRVFHPFYFDFPMSALDWLRKIRRGLYGRSTRLFDWRRKPGG